MKKLWIVKITAIVFLFCFFVINSAFCVDMAEMNEDVSVKERILDTLEKRKGEIIAQINDWPTKSTAMPLLNAELASIKQKIRQTKNQLVAVINYVHQGETEYKGYKLSSPFVVEKTKKEDYARFAALQKAAEILNEDKDATRNVWVARIETYKNASTGHIKNVPVLTKN